MEWNTYQAGDVIFREGEPSNAAFLIVSGNVEIVKGYDTARPKTIAVVGGGEYIGEMGAIDDQPRSASAVAKEAVACKPVTREEFLDLILKHPEEAIDLLKILFERLRIASNKLAELEEREG